ncbi:hypothetical protein CLOM_g7905 [Closterium sp. NIES-68]|nr:hypothetical protein CLOM_g7905 [Closterium sp. NIES-68]GJP58241.1 hypothetical protein CLOP_g22707 [Closterium sp. NIES-67]
MVKVKLLAQLQQKLTALGFRVEIKKSAAIGLLEVTDGQDFLVHLRNGDDAKSLHREIRQNRFYAAANATRSSDACESRGDTYNAYGSQHEDGSESPEARSPASISNSGFSGDGTGSGSPYAWGLDSRDARSLTVAHLVLCFYQKCYCADVKKPQGSSGLSRCVSVVSVH